MAVLATPDWTHQTRDKRMDVPTNTSRQRMSPASDQGSQGQSSPLSPSPSSPQQQPLPQPQQSQQHLQSLQQQQFQQQQQQLLQQQMLLAAQQHPSAGFSYPVQQQPQGSWTPNITAPPFYPSFFQGHQGQQSQQPYPNQLPPQQPYFDPANAQLAAQWAYQQMMFNAQHGFPPVPPQHHSPSQRPSNSNQSAQPQSPTEYFAQNQLFKQFPSGTPPPPPHRTPSGGGPDQGAQQYPGPGFHPYRRPNRQQSQPHSPSDSVNDWRQGIGNIPHPPYARPDASGSTSSVNSSSSRQRTNSNQSVKSNGHASHRSSPAPPSGTQSSARSTPSPAASPPSPSGASNPLRQPHHRNSSTSSSTSTSTATSTRPGALSPSSVTSTSSVTASSASATATNSSPNGSATPRLNRPSPLSQGTFTVSEKRISRDDIDLGAMHHDTIQAAGSRSAGLKGRLRRALSFNSANVLKEDDAIQEDDDASIKASQLNPSSSTSKMKGKAVAGSAVTPEKTINGTDSGVDDASSTAPVPKKKSRAASLFNSRMNMSTDNISLSSTVSSASVMIRKLGAMGKLARRNSLAGITSLFKDKDKDKDGDKDKKGKKKKSAKSEASEASVSHVTAELDRMGSDWTVSSSELNGLSPAAKLARQHTLKSNAEAAARAKEAEAAAARDEEVKADGDSGAAGVPTWDRNTATRQTVPPQKSGLANMRINEDGTRTLVEDEEDESDDGHYEHQQGSFGAHSEGWEDDEDWDVEGDGDMDEDVTIRADIRQGSGSGSGADEGVGYRPSTEMEPWAVDIRRSVERSRKPARSILKNANTYDQSSYLQQDHGALNRSRANSYTAAAPSSELGPLARIPSPDPDHIDGLHRHNSHSSSHGPHASNINEPAPILPPLSFEGSSPMATTFTTSGSKDLPPSPPSPTHSDNRSSAIFQHPTFNSSAPALSTIGSSSSKSPPTLTHRSQTAPIKRLTFASNLSVYDTFSPGVYDRRSEPATWSRLTPALAQRIKEELNSYKMEEMEVHAASRIHTQFFV